MPFIMEYSVFNGTDLQDSELKAGDRVHAEIVCEGGKLSFKIQKGKDEPVYESDGVFFSHAFDVEIEEDGIYTVTVTGKNAKGSVSFVKE